MFFCILCLSPLLPWHLFLTMLFHSSSLQTESKGGRGEEEEGKEKINGGEREGKKQRIYISLWLALRVHLHVCALRRFGTVLDILLAFFCPFPHCTEAASSDNTHFHILFIFAGRVLSLKKAIR
ncbi:hypothetical protein HOY82DRAFT_546191 [Tuber indicum]|nr:hypothetical protein HOY82DRAFT_546191 [Tuber indicum]